MKWTQGKFVLYDQREKVDVEAVHRMLMDSYWAKDRSLQTVRDTVDRCLCFSLYRQDNEDGQIGFTRVLTDYATYGLILDVLIHMRYRGLGLGGWMMECVTNHPKIATLKQALWTSTAFEFYQKYGFRVPEHMRFMLKRVESSK